MHRVIFRAEKFYSLFIWQASACYCNPVVLFSPQPGENVYNLERIQGTVMTDTKGQVNIPWWERGKARALFSSRRSRDEDAFGHILQGENRSGERDLGSGCNALKDPASRSRGPVHSVAVRHFNCLAEAMVKSSGNSSAKVTHSLKCFSLWAGTNTVKSYGQYLNADLSRILSTMSFLPLQHIYFTVWQEMKPTIL